MSSNPAGLNVASEGAVDLALGDLTLVSRWVTVSLQLQVLMPTAAAKRRVCVAYGPRLVHSFFAYSSDAITVHLRLPVAESDVARRRLSLKLFADQISHPDGGRECDTGRPLFVVCAVNAKDLPLLGAPEFARIAQAKAIAQELFPPASGNPWGRAGDLALRIDEAIRTRTPFAFVRFGDGEGRILGFEDHFTQHTLISEVLRYQFGARVLPALRDVYGEDYLYQAAAHLRELVRGAMQEADVVGVPSWLHFRGEPTDQNVTALLGQYCCLDAVLRCKSPIDPRSVFDHLILHAPGANDLIKQTLRSLEFLGVVGHTDISDLISRHFAPRRTAFVRVPAHQSFMKSDELHFPGAYDNVLRTLDVPFRGAPFLVAAGYMGKVYCTAIKQKGGIAVDIGSMFDAWIGKGRTDAVKNVRIRLE